MTCGGGASVTNAGVVPRGCILLKMWLTSVVALCPVVASVWQLPKQFEPEPCGGLMLVAAWWYVSIVLLARRVVPISGPLAVLGAREPYSPGGGEAPNGPGGPIK